MTTMTSRPIQITDHRGKFPNHAYDHEPNPGSVVLTNGEFGTAWQRMFSNGLWYPVAGPLGSGRTWEEMLAERNLVLVYDSPMRPEKGEPR